MFRRLICRFIGHHASMGHDVFWPGIRSTWVFCTRCGEMGWIDKP